MLFLVKPVCLYVNCILSLVPFVYALTMTIHSPVTGFLGGVWPAFPQLWTFIHLFLFTKTIVVVIVVVTCKKALDLCWTGIHGEDEIVQEGSDDGSNKWSNPVRLKLYDMYVVVNVLLEVTVTLKKYH